MKQGRALDSDIALLIMGKRPAKVENIPFYSSDLFDSYKVVQALQSKGWHFNIKSEIHQTGTMNYVVRFSQGNRFTEIQHAIIPLAICNCAIKIANGEIEEWVDPNRTYGVEEIKKILEVNLDKFFLPSENELKFSDIISEENLQKLPYEMARFIVGVLQANDLSIKKADSE